MKIKIDTAELKEGISRGCDYSGTQEVVHDSFLDVMSSMGCEGDWDEMSTTDLFEKEIVIQDLIEAFYDDIIEKLVNYIFSCEVKDD